MSDQKKRRRRKPITQKLRESAAVRALMTNATVEAAAVVCGVGESTLRRWMADPKFSRRLARAQRTAFRLTVNALVGRNVRALSTLDRLMGCGSPAVECRAAEAWLSHAMRWCEVWHQREDIEKLRDQVQELAERAAQREAEEQRQ
jgi:hypothetical protein